MKCEKCNQRVKQTLVDNSVSIIGRYITVAYYCDACDEIFIIEKYKDKIDKHKFDDEYSWLREQNNQLKSR